MSDLSFNLIDEGFIPCVMNDGTYSEFGLRHTLEQAHTIREIRDDSPLVTIALHRLLLAILHRNFGPYSDRDWEAIWEAGRFDAGKLSNYFEHWRQRFDLFDAEHPFYQSADLSSPEPQSIGSLFDEIAVNNNATLFDHTHNERTQEALAAKSARGLVTRQAFALGLGQPPKGVTLNGSPLKLTSRKDSSLARGVTFLIVGDHLFETLMLNLTPIEPHEKGAPVWEQDHPESLMDRQLPLGRTDHYTHQCRRIRLDPALAGKIHFVQGRELDKSVLDPMKGYKKDESQGWLPYSFESSRLLWRDSAALFAYFSQPDCPFLAWHYAARRCRAHFDSLQYRLDAFGLETAKGKATSIVNWRHESIPLPAPFLKDESVRGWLSVAVGLTQEVARLLEVAMHRLAGQLLKATSQFSEDDSEKAAEFTAKNLKSPRPKANPTGEWARKLAADRLYWSRLEIPFRQLLLDVSKDYDKAERAVAKWGWHTVRPIALQAFDEAADQIDHSARVLRAAAVASSQLRRTLNHQLQDQKEILDDAV